MRTGGTTSGATGEILLQTGTSGNGQAGDISLSVGKSTGGPAGNVIVASEILRRQVETLLVDMEYLPAVVVFR